jgi:hypothetical protein
MRLLLFQKLGPLVSPFHGTDISPIQRRNFAEMFASMEMRLPCNLLSFTLEELDESVMLRMFLLGV